MELTSNEVVISIVPSSHDSLNGQSAFDDLASQAQDHISISGTSIDTNIIIQRRQRTIQFKDGKEVFIEGRWYKILICNVPIAKVKRLGHYIDVKRGLITWDVDKVDYCQSINSREEREKLVNYALNGFDVAALSFSVGDETTIGEERKQDLHLILSLLQGRIDNSMHEIKMEYACIGVNDQDCYDIRKDKHRSNRSIFFRGMDSIMRRAYSVHDIWIKVEQELAKTPYILTIKLTDQVNMTEGRLMLIDMLHPTFSPLQQPKEGDKAHFSFINLCDKIYEITSPVSNQQHFETKPYLLTHEMAKYVAGHNKMTVFTYLSEHMSGASEFKDVKACLSLTSRIRDFSVRMIKNRPLVKDEKYKYKELNEEFQTRCTELKAENDELKPSNKEMKHRIAAQETTIRDLCYNLKQVYAYSRLNDYQVKYLKAINDVNACIKEMQNRKLEAENAYLTGALYIREFLDRDLLQKLKSIDKDVRIGKSVQFKLPKP